MGREQVPRQLKRQYRVSRPHPVVPAEGGSLSPRAMKADYVIDENGCWIWQKHTLRGYGTGSFTTIGIKTGWAHRAYYEVANGAPVPEGWDVHHKCHTKACVNPEHLEAIDHGLHLTEHKMAQGPLTWEIVREIRASALAGEKLKVLVERYGVSWGTLHPVVRNQTWHDPEYVFVLHRVCEGCNAPFETLKSNQRFCTPDHNTRRAA